ncbi:MAG: tRNA (adenosine(37)-N6)-dimethylallyltransferase MiaA [Cyclobacteriaceae bacterium]
MKREAKRALIVVVGPTAVGKTDVAIRLAQHFHTEVVSADSRQVFMEPAIGTAKPNANQLAQVPHHFVGVRSIAQPYDAGEFGRDALETIERLLNEKKVVVMCGGSGLYVKAVCEGFDDMPEIKEGLRGELMGELLSKGIESLQSELQEKDPEYFAVVDLQNPHRLVRALEIIRSTGMPVTNFRKASKRPRPFQIVKIGLELGREELYQRIDSRVDEMVRMGLEEEARELYPHRATHALQTVGYQEWFGYFDADYDREEAIRLIKRNTRRYAKRQLTWFKKDAEIAWFKPANWRGILDHLSAEGIG